MYDLFFRSKMKNMKPSCTYRLAIEMCIRDRDDGVQIPVNLQQDVLLIYGDGYDVTGKQLFFLFLAQLLSQHLVREMCIRDSCCCAPNFQAVSIEDMLNAISGSSDSQWNTRLLSERARAITWGSVHDYLVEKKSKRNIYGV